VPLVILFLSLLVVLALAIALLGYAATKPPRLKVQRSTSVTAAPEVVFGLIDDFRKWPSWSAHDLSDPTMTRTYDGAGRGKGAVSEWKSAGPGGEGRMEIVESVPPSRLVVEVVFRRPFRAHNSNELTLSPDGNRTMITWAWDGANVYVMKVMSVFVDMDKLMGKHFETGLANLKALAERSDHA
jgi:hypothetical protein